MIRRKTVMSAEKILGIEIVVEKRGRGRPKRNAPTTKLEIKKNGKVPAAPQPPKEDGTMADPNKIRRSPANELAINERRREVLSLIRKGWEIDEVADQLGLSRTVVSDDYNAELYALRRHNMNDADKIREDELSRLNTLTAHLLPMCQAHEVQHPKNPEVMIARPPSPPHVFALLKVMERRAKMLGIDAPEKKIDIQVPWELLNADQIARLGAGGDIRVILAELETSQGGRRLSLPSKTEEIIDAVALPEDDDG